MPEITALQFAAISLLFSGEKTGREIRQHLEKWDGPRTSAAFSQLMDRLRKSALVDGMREGRPGERFSECRYCVTDLGVILWQEAQQFYAGFAPPPPELEPVETIEVEFADHPPAERSRLVKEKFTKVMLQTVLLSRNAPGRLAEL